MGEIRDGLTESLNAGTSDEVRLFWLKACEVDFEKWIWYYEIDLEPVQGSTLQK